MEGYVNIYDLSPDCRKRIIDKMSEEDRIKYATIAMENMLNKTRWTYSLALDLQQACNAMKLHTNLRFQDADGTIYDMQEELKGARH